MLVVLLALGPAQGATEPGAEARVVWRGGREVLDARRSAALERRSLELLGRCSLDSPSRTRNAAPAIRRCVMRPVLRWSGAAPRVRGGVAHADQRSILWNS